MAEAEVRAAFRVQAEWCRKLGSPFTALLCDTLARDLDRSTRTGARALVWAGRPDALGESVPLRLAGGFHALVRRGALPELAALYPPHPMPNPDALARALRAAMAEADDALAPWLDLPPQTNEVARSGVLAAGLAIVAAETGRSLDLLELGASAGLNLLPDRYDIRLARRRYGDPASPVRLEPAWEGPGPPPAAIAVAARRGVDINPLDVTSAADRERLLAYVWADQPDRLARLDAALRVAAADPPPLDRADAADWLEARLAEPPSPGAARVVMHSIAFQYFSEVTQARIGAALAAAGESATAPLAWLRYEAQPEGGPSLRLRSWPGGGDRLLARADPHGRRISWQV